MANCIEVKNFSKRYGDIQAVNNLSFYVQKGSFFAFLGPNGAGKSTTINCLCTFLTPDSGDITVNGFTLGKQNKEIRNSIGIVFQENVLDKLLTVRENLEMRAQFYNLKGTALQQAVLSAAEAAQVTDFLDRRYGQLSGGQKRRADIARAFVHTPDILILDEPTTGLDPQTRKGVWDTIYSLQKQQGMTVFLTTHYMEEAAKADCIAVIKKGELAAKGTPAQLKETYTGDHLEIQPKNLLAVSNILNEQKVHFTVNGQTVSVNLTKTVEAISILQPLKPYVKSFEVKTGTVDDAFLAIMSVNEKQ